MTRGSHLLCAAIAIAVAAAPLPFGSVDPLAANALSILLLALSLIWVTMRRRAGRPPLPWNDPLLLTGAALLAYGLLQMTPLPAGIAHALSPASASLKAAYAPHPPAWTALSLYPFATWRSCLNVACWTLAALMVRDCAVDLVGRLIVAGGLAAGGLFQAGYGLFEFISGRQHIFSYQKKYFTDVATGTFISRNNYAGYLEMAIPMALALAVLCLGRSRGTEWEGRSAAPGASLKRRLSSATGREGFRALLLVMGAFLMTMALLMSRSRMGIISIAFALVAGGLVLSTRRRTRGLALACVAVAAMAAVFASRIDILPVVDRFAALRGEVAGGYGRLRVWEQAMPMLAAYPLVGSGLGTWETAFSPFRDDAAQVRVDFAHNDYLEFAAEAGLCGVLILAAGAWACLRRRARSGAEAGGLDEIALAAGAGLASLALHSLVDFHLSIPADAMAAAVLTGLFLRRSGPAAMPAWSATTADRAPGRRSTPSRWIAWCLTSAALVGLGLSAAPPVLARMAPEPAQGRAAREDESLEGGAVVAAWASPDEEMCPGCGLDPFNADRRIEAASRARRRLLKDVETLLRAQSEGSLPDPASRLYLARRLDRALSLVDEALQMEPASGAGHLEAGLLRFGRFLLIGLPPGATEDFDLARASFGKALALQPWRAASHRKVARMVAPFWQECDDDQRRFIEKTVREARALDPEAKDIQEMATGMGL